MWTFLTGVWGKLLAGLGIVLGALAILAGAKRAGVKEERGRRLERELAGVRIRNEVEREVRHAPDDEVDDLLRRPADRGVRNDKAGR